MMGESEPARPCDYTGALGHVKNIFMPVVKSPPAGLRGGPCLRRGRPAGRLWFASVAVPSPP